MKKCFIVSPIGDRDSTIREQADHVLKYLIEPVCKELGLESIRADKKCTPGSISQAVFKDLDDSDIVIADLTGLNANVMLEIGYRLSNKRPYVLIRNEEDAEKIPFDIQDYRIYVYSLKRDREEECKETIKNFINDALKENNEFFKSLHIRKANGRIVQLCDADGVTFPKSQVPDKWRKTLMERAKVTEW